MKKLKSWMAYRITGAKAEKADGVIKEAEAEAWVKFEAKTPMEKVRIFVREMQ
jgi:hypothetical protein